jgi:hypothetical protein
VSDQPVPNGHVGPTAKEIAGLVSAERTAGEYVPVPEVSAVETGGEPGGTETSGAETSRAETSRAETSGAETSGGKISGTAAVAAAEQRAASTAGRNIEDIPPLPIPADTANARSGPPLHSACTTLLPLLGVWRGTGLFGNHPGAKDPQFGQQITISHDGRPFLRYESVCWLLAPDGSVTGPGPRELGFWRPQPDGSIELLVAHSEGRIELFYGRSRSGGTRGRGPPTPWSAPRWPHLWSGPPACTASPLTAGWRMSTNVRTPTSNWPRTPRRP